MADELTLGELDRRFSERFADFRDELQQLVQLIDKRVSMERYQYENQARDERERVLAERVKALEEASAQAARDKAREQQEKAAQRASDRRLIFSALIVPVLLVVLQVYLSTRGAGS